MLTIRKLGVTVGDDLRAANAARYLLDPADAPEAFVRVDAEGADEPGRGARANTMWLGSATALQTLGVERGAEVLPEQLARALQGRHVETGAQLRRPGTRSVPGVDAEGEPCLVLEQRVNSVDLPFSAPKSVSVVWSQAGPALREAIEHAMMVAANATLQYMTQTKPVVQGTGEPADGFVASATLHVTARKAQGELVPDPQLHVHGVVVGIESRHPGAWPLRTPGTDALFKHGAPLEGGAVGRAVLAEELRKLGFDIDWGTGRQGRFFELKVPAPLIERMSKRAREIESETVRLEAAAGEPLSGRDRAAVALKHRAPKDRGLSGATMVGAWDAQAQAQGFGRAEAEALCNPGRATTPIAELRTQARAAILTRLWERGPTVSLGEARAIAFEVAPMGLTVQQASELLDEMQRTGDVIALAGGLATSREIRSLEQYVNGVAIGAARRQSRPVSDVARSRGIEAADRKLGEGNSLDPDQQDAITRLTRGAGWATLTGRAGTGKGPVLQAVAEGHRHDGWRVIACAVDGATAQRLGHQIDSHALTIEQVMHRATRGTLRVDDRTLILIEEASKVGLRHWGQIARLAERHGVRVIAVGHAGQLGAIELPGMFGHMLAEQAIPTAELTTIRRHQDPRVKGKTHPWLTTYQVELDQGHGKEAVQILRDNKAIAMHETREEAMQALVDGWDRRRRAYRDPREAILVVHGPNEDVDQVNKLAQKRRRAAGDLLGPGVRAVDRDYLIYAGDVVMVRAGAYQFEARGVGAPVPRRVENGTIGIVESVDPERDRVRVLLDEPGSAPRLVEIDQGRLRARIDGGEERVAALRLAYAFHPFPLQGATVNDVGVLAGHWSQSKEATYVADTRARHGLHVHVDRESLGTNGSDEDRFKRYARRVKRSGNRSASIGLAEASTAIAVQLPSMDSVPAFPRRATEQRPEVETVDPATITAADRRSVRVDDPLAPYRGVLGVRRARSIEARAEKIASQVQEWDVETLRMELEQSRAAFGSLDRAGARETLRIEAARLAADRRIEQAATTARALEARALEARAVRRRAERRDLLQAADIQRRLVARDVQALALLAASERALRRDRRHLDGWMKDSASRAALWVAVERELAVRSELARRADPEASLSDPSSRLLKRRGPVPGRTEPERTEWQRPSA